VPSFSKGAEIRTGVEVFPEKSIHSDGHIPFEKRLLSPRGKRWGAGDRLGGLGDAADPDRDVTLLLHKILEKENERNT